jgi:hypothetical protein
MNKTLHLIFTICLFFVIAVPVVAPNPFFDDFNNQHILVDQDLIDRVNNLQSQTISPDLLVNDNVLADLFGNNLRPEETDLQLLSLQVEAPRGNEPGDIVNLIGVIRNSGDTLITKYEYAFYVNGRNRGPARDTQLIYGDYSVDVQGVNNGFEMRFFPNHTRTVRLNHIQLPTSRTINFQLRVDPFDRIEESNENNNLQANTFHITYIPPEPVDDANLVDDQNNDGQVDDNNIDNNADDNNQNNNQGNDPADNGNNNAGDNNANNNNDPFDDQNNQPQEQRHSEDEADDEIDQANRICRDARDILDIAKENLRDRLSVDFDDDDTDRADERIDEAQTSIREGREHISNNQFDAAVDKADRAKSLCQRVDRDLDIIVPNNNSVQAQNQAPVQRQRQIQQYQQHAEPPQEPQQNVQLVHNPSLTTPQDNAEPEGVAAWVIASMVVLGGLVAVEVVVLIYYLTR